MDDVKYHSMPNFSYQNKVNGFNKIPAPKDECE